MKKLTAILSLTLFLSCSKEFLDKRNLSQIGVETFWKDSADAMLALHGIYDAIPIAEICSYLKLDEVNLCGNDQNDQSNTI